jgi:hypothetical protein
MSLLNDFSVPIGGGR